jgi:predicted MPP superfamily phosphohydrolase
MRFAMFLFLIIFFLIYGGMHLYLFARIKSAILLGTGASIFLIILFVFMMLAPLIVRFSEQYGLEISARFMAYTGYIWMGVLLIFFVTSLLFDLYRLIVYTGRLILPAGTSLLTPSPMFSLVVPLLLSMCINAYGYFEAKNIHIERITVESEKIPEVIGSIRVAQISDVHIGIIVRGKRLEKIVDEIKKIEPDILVSTGDLMDGQMNNLVEPLRLLKSIRPKYGKFAIIGNHEVYAGLNESIGFMRDYGFTVLRGEGRTIPGIINIVGIDDPAGRYMGLSREVAEDHLLSQFPSKNFTLLLKHQPVVDINATGLFDLQISGHTHKGQIFPFSLVTKLYFPMLAGYFDLPKQSHLYVSRGTGTWGPPIRFLAPPEITIIDLIHKKKQP